MSSSDPLPRLTRRLVLLGTLALVGCGFAPVYGPGASGGVLRNAVAVEAPATVEGFHLRQQLVDRLGAPGNARYLLTVSIEIGRDPVAISASGVTTRFNLPGSATWALSDAATGAPLAQGEVSAFSGYSTTSSTVATRAAERDATERLTVTLADLIVTRLLVAAQDF